MNPEPVDAAPILTPVAEVPEENGTTTTTTTELKPTS